MLSLLALVLVTQLSGEPPETTAVRKLIDTELISVSSVSWDTTRLRQRDRTFTLADEEWSTAFALVPEAQKLAVSLRESYDFGMTMVRVGIGLELAGLAGAGGLALMALTIGVLPVATIVALALLCGAVGLAGAVVALIGLPAAMRSQTGTFEVVSTYNHGLARQPLLSIPLGP